MIENSYGIVKRLDFVEKAISDHKPRTILDIGCGTGELLTLRLAKKFPEIEFVGVDDDTRSIEFARDKNVGVDNLTFLYLDEIEPSARFDMVIASEVIEHVEHPDEFLSLLKGYLEPNGRVIITLPNGYGPFEATAFLESILFLIGIDAPDIYRSVSKTHSGGDNGNPTEVKYSLAVSPHINFFSYREIRKLIKGNGLEIVEFRPRTFLCGIGFDQIIRGRILTGWNSKLAELLPPQFSSDWMFIAEVCKANADEIQAVYELNKYARYRKRINQKRWTKPN